MAFASSTRVRHRFRSSSSTWTRLQNDSMTALSKQSPTEPVEVSRPESRARLCALVAVNDGAAVGSALVDCHTECAGHERSGRSAVDRPPDHASRPGVEDDGAVDLSFSSRVLCHVGDPELIGLVAVKLARDPIFCGRDTSQVTKLWSS